MNKFILSLCGAFIISGCVSYEPDPIDKQEISKKILKELNPPEIKDSAFQFKDAVELMSRHNKELALLKQSYKNSLKAAEIKTPLPNPEVTFGLARAFRLDEKSAGSTQPFISAAFTIPLSGRLSIQDDLSKLEAEHKLQKLISRHRGLFMELRSAFINYSITSKHFRHQAKVIDLMEKILVGNRQLVDSGFYTALDIQRIQLETLNQKSTLMEIEAIEISRKADLEELICKILNVNQFEEPLQVNFEVPDLEKVWAVTLENNPDLNEIFMHHTIAEKKLELEIRKQYPDLKIGTDAEQDPGERKRLLSLSIGMDLPIFDRNQVKIQKALSAREELKMKFEKKASALRVKLQSDLKLLKQEVRHYNHIENNIIPKMAELLETAKKAVEAGQLPINRYWDFKTRSLEIEKELFEKKAHIYKVVASLEKNAGRPLIEIFKFDRKLFAELEVEK